MRRTLFLASLLLLVAVSSFAGHFIYSPGKPLSDADRAELAERGITVQRALTGGRYLVSVAKTREVLATDSTDGLETLTPERKILRSAIHEAAKAKSVAHLRVMFHPDVTFDEARQAVLAAGAVFDDVFAWKLEVMQQIDVLVPAAALHALASDDRVFAIAGMPAKKVRSDNQITAQLSHVTELLTAPYDLTGKGVSVSLFELAEGQADHPEFVGRLTVNATGGTTSDKQHATHVTGTIGASGKEPQAKGMAPEATINQYKASGSASQWLKAKDDLLQPLGVVADNNSWGYVLGWDVDGSDHVWSDLAEFFGAYDLVYTAPIDQITRERGVLFVHSAGNEADLPALNNLGQHRHVDNNGDTITDKWYCYSASGSGTDCALPCSAGREYCETVRHMAGAPFDTIGLTASGKNSLAVGAIDSEKGIANFSGRGPAKDGRVKPDIVARGVNVLSTSTNSNYVRKSGTSMSSPAVTGIAVLLTQQWRRTFNNASPTPEQLKALLIAGADDLGNTGPDYTFGYGLANAKASVDLIRDDAAQGTRIKTSTLATGQRYETSINLAEAQKLRVTLQWLDPEIAFLEDDDEVAAKALVNDLDLTVTGPAGNVVLPWLLNPAAPTATASRGVNTRDNTEIVEIANAAPGIYRVAVAGKSIVDRSPQSFTLITSAASAPPCFDRFESNDTSESAVTDLSPSRLLEASLCSATDVDFFKFSLVRGGTVSIVANATGDTPVRITLTRTGFAPVTVDIPAHDSRTLTFTVPGGNLAQPMTVSLKFETTGSIGTTPVYTFVPNFPVAQRGRTVRK